jgi:transcription antitermination factor NusG
MSRIATIDMDVAQIEARALEIAAALERRDGPYYAQTIEHVTPAWHIVRTTPGQESKATDYLADRGIGVFLPRFIAGSRLKLGNEFIDLGDKLLFPGRVFVFVWDVLAHWRRIMACPGVQAIMLNGSEKPVIVPDTEVDRIQVMQYVLAVARPKRRKRYTSVNDRITISTLGYNQIDGNERNRVLDRLLGAAS